MRLVDNSLGEFVTLQLGCTGENLYSLDASQTTMRLFPDCLTDWGLRSRQENPCCAKTRPRLIVSEASEER